LLSEISSNFVLFLVEKSNLFQICIKTVLHFSDSDEKYFSQKPEKCFLLLGLKIFKN
jgi:hypothetical protein